MQALEKRSSGLFNLVQESYAASLAQEPALSGLLLRIKSNYLGEPSGAGMQGLLSGMMQMLTSG